MKRFIAFFKVVLLMMTTVYAFTSCSSGSNDDESEITTAEVFPEDAAICCAFNLSSNNNMTMIESASCAVFVGMKDPSKMDSYSFNKTVWKTSDPEVLSVRLGDEKESLGEDTFTGSLGTMYAHKPGTAILTATDEAGMHTLSLTVTVVAKPAPMLFSVTRPTALYLALRQLSYKTTNFLFISARKATARSIITAR